VRPVVARLIMEDSAASGVDYSKPRRPQDYPILKCPSLGISRHRPIPDEAHEVPLPPLSVELAPLGPSRSPCGASRPSWRRRDRRRHLAAGRV